MSSGSLGWAINEWPLWGGCHATPVLVKPLLGGLTNKSYLLKAAGKQFVLRVLASNSGELDINRKAEQTASRLAAAAGLAPMIIFLDPERRYSVADYVEGSVLSESSYSGRKKIDTVARLLRNLHSIDIKHHNLPALNVVEKAQNYWLSIEAQGSHGTLVKLKPNLQSYFKHHSYTSSKLCLCHNDPVASNLLATNSGLKLIDWEYAAAGNPLFDLAIFILSERLNEEQEVLFLSDYELEVDSQALAKAKLDVMYLEWLWWLVQDRRDIDDQTVQRQKHIEGQLLALIGGC